MDYNKNIIIIGLLVLLISPLATAYMYAHSPSGNLDVNYDTNLWSFTRFLDENSTTTLSFASSYNITNPFTVLKITRLPGDSNTAGLLTIDCGNVNVSKTYNLSAVDSWVDEGFRVFSIPSTYIPYNTDNTSRVQYQVCDITLTSASAYLSLYAEPYPSLFQIQSGQDPSLANMVAGTRNIMTSGFVLLDMLIMITALVFFAVLIVFLWKLFEYFVSRFQI
jgi:hypothetical protein